MFMLRSFHRRLSARRDRENRDDDLGQPTAEPKPLSRLRERADRRRVRCIPARRWNRDALWRPGLWKQSTPHQGAQFSRWRTGQAKPCVLSRCFAARGHPA